VPFFKERGKMKPFVKILIFVLVLGVIYHVAPGAIVFFGKALGATLGVIAAIIITVALFFLFLMWVLFSKR
jgi:hypothetical protein